MAQKERLTRLTVVKKKLGQKYSISISGDSAEKLDLYCESEDRTPSWTISKLIELHLRKLPRTTR